LLPLGISFYTFEAIAYLADIYRGNLQPEEDLLIWLCGVFFFPKFSSGPITRMQQLLPQLQKREVTLPLATEGLRRILLGAMAKVVLADGIAVLVNGFYGDMTAHSSLSVLLAVFLYPLQLYFDFMGYSGMAIGSALLFGIRLEENFKAPYFASSIGEFWSRWHISLSGWFRDYVYFPLGGSRCSALRAALNLLAVFALSGIWHGSTANYLLWGLLLGLARILERRLQLRRGSKDALPLGRVYTLGVWTLSLVFFRLPSLNQVRQLIGSVLRPVSLSSFVPDLLNTAASDIAYSGTYFLIYFGSLLAAGLLQLWFDSKLHRSLRQGAPCTDPLADLCPALRWALYWLIGFITAAMYLITQTSASPSFIYAGY
ncbi:MAG: MBOAT family protein, partial [Oscillospiraceae bacterium]|nr:MBOAT family protein [Oscillospiraceae bacterium]